MVPGPPAVPDRVRAARDRAAAAGFELSSDDDVGRLLAVLAAGVPAGGRVLELGTGAGVGTAWLVHGLGARTDVELVTVEADPDTAARARSAPWPDHVTFVVDDAVTTLGRFGAGRFDLVFADAPGGKWERLDLTIAALAPGGVVVVDDMDFGPGWDAEQEANQARVRATLLSHPDLVGCGLDWATGVVLATRRR